MTLKITPADIGRLAVCRNGSTVTINALKNGYPAVITKALGTTRWYGAEGKFSRDGLDDPYDIITWVDATPADVGRTAIRRDGTCARIDEFYDVARYHVRAGEYCRDKNGYLWGIKVPIEKDLIAWADEYTRTVSAPSASALIDKIEASLKTVQAALEQAAKDIAGRDAEIARLKTVQGAAGVLRAADATVILRACETLWNMDNFIAMLLALVEDKTP